MNEDYVIATAHAAETRNPLRLEMNGYVTALTASQARKLSALGVSNVIGMMTRGLIGVAIGRICKSDFWEPDEGGATMIVVPAIADGVIVDLCAFEPRMPDAWALRTGNGWALGADAVMAAQQGWRGDCLSLHMTPLEWLRASGDGACIIDGFTHRSAFRVRNAAAIEVSDNTVARALRLQLSKPPRLPEIVSRGSQRHAA